MKQLSLIESLGNLVEHFKSSVELLISLLYTLFFIEVKLCGIHAAYQGNLLNNPSSLGKLNLAVVSGEGGRHEL